MFSFILNCDSSKKFCWKGSYWSNKALPAGFIINARLGFYCIAQLRHCKSISVRILSIFTLLTLGFLLTKWTKYQIKLRFTLGFALQRIIKLLLILLCCFIKKRFNRCIINQHPPKPSQQVHYTTGSEQFNVCLGDKKNDLNVTFHKIYSGHFVK